MEFLKQAKSKKTQTFRFNRRSVKFEQDFLQLNRERIKEISKYKIDEKIAKIQDSKLIAIKNPSK